MHDALKEWFAPAQIDRRTLWRWLEPEACRLAAAYWWPTLPLSDLRSMMRLHVAQIVRRPYAQSLATEIKTEPNRSEIAQQVLDEAVRTMWIEHENSFTALLEATTDALRAGGQRDAVVAAALSLARKRAPLPPPWLVQDAIEKAAKEHRFETEFWTQRRRRAG